MFTTRMKPLTGMCCPRSTPKLKCESISKGTKGGLGYPYIIHTGVNDIRVENIIFPHIPSPVFLFLATLDVCVIFDPYPISHTHTTAVDSCHIDLSVKRLSTNDMCQHPLLLCTCQTLLINHSIPCS